MSAKDESITMELERLNALFAWWGVPLGSANGQIDGQMKRIQAFTSDLQKTYGEAYSRQMSALVAANERIAGSLQEFLRCRQPQDLVAAESHLVATIMEGASQQATAWVELTQKVQDCYAAMARAMADEIRQRVSDGTGAKPPAKAAPSPATSRHAAQA